MNVNELGDEEDFHLPEEISWSLVKQWFKAIYSRLISLKECFGKDVVDVAHSQNYWAHNHACQQYINQLKKVQREIDVAVELARGTYFDKDSIRIKKRNNRFVRFDPYNNDRPSSTVNSGDRVLSDRPEVQEGSVDTTQPS